MPGLANVPVVFSRRAVDMTSGQRDDWNGKALLTSFIRGPSRMIIYTDPPVKCCLTPSLGIAIAADIQRGASILLAVECRSAFPNQASRMLAPLWQSTRWDWNRAT
jgi:hypothetical protein